MLQRLHNLFVKPRVDIEWTPYHTPDYQQLQDAPGWPVFEYGEFKSYLPQHKKLKAEMRAVAFTCEKMPLWAHHKGEETAAVALRINNPQLPLRRASIVGEIYVVPTNNIPFLDNHRLNGVYFDRKMVKVCLPDGNQVRAFMYVGKSKVFGPWLDWDHNFYRGREGSAFSVVAPTRLMTGWYSDFNQQHFKQSCNKCFIGLTNGAAEPPK